MNKHNQICVRSFVEHVYAFSKLQEGESIFE